MIQCCLLHRPLEPLSSKKIFFLAGLPLFFGFVWLEKAIWEYFHTKYLKIRPQNPFFALKGRQGVLFCVMTNFWPKKFAWYGLFDFLVTLSSWPVRLQKPLMCAKLLGRSFWHPLSTKKIFCMPWKAPQKIYPLWVFYGRHWKYWAF